MLRVGVTGGLASGKSFIGETLASFGCHLISADKLGHEVLAQGEEAFQPVLDAFGPGILSDDGSINRRALGTIVFGDPQRLAVLNSLVHPAIFRRQDQLVEQFAVQDPGGIVVIEAAIMIESGSYVRNDKLIVASCPEELQIKRAMKRDHLSREQVLLRLRSQMPLAEKVRLADYVIDTSGDKQDTVRQIRSVYDELRGLVARTEHSR